MSEQKYVSHVGGKRQMERAGERSVEEEQEEARGWLHMVKV